MATVRVDVKREETKEILLYCGVSEEEASKILDDWGK